MWPFKSKKANRDSGEKEQVKALIQGSTQYLDALNEYEINKSKPPFIMVNFGEDKIELAPIELNDTDDYQDILRKIDSSSRWLNYWDQYTELNLGKVEIKISEKSVSISKTECNPLWCAIVSRLLMPENSKISFWYFDMRLMPSICTNYFTHDECSKFTRDYMK